MTDFKPVPIKPIIPFSDLEKIDIRVGTIELVEDIPGSDKLVKMSVNFTNEVKSPEGSQLETFSNRIEKSRDKTWGSDCKKTVVVGMKKERENPKEVEGKQALFVVNLPVREMVNIKSEAMLFDIGYADGIIPVLSVPEKPVPNGARVG